MIPVISETINQFNKLIPDQVAVQLEGKLIRMVGLTLQAVGCQVTIGDRCLVDDGVNKIETEVVGFDGDHTLMPLQPIVGIRSGAKVTPCSKMKYWQLEMSYLVESSMALVNLLMAKVFCTENQTLLAGRVHQPTKTAAIPNILM